MNRTKIGWAGFNTLTNKYLTTYGLSLDTKDRYLKSLDKLMKRDVEVFIGSHPSHNDTLGKLKRMGGTNNPFVDRNSWPVFLNSLKKRANEIDNIFTKKNVLSLIQ